MINLQSSKRLIKTFDDIVSNGIQQIHSDHFPLDPLPQPKHSPSPNYQYSRTLSKMVKIEFDQRSSARQNNEVRAKRKLMTSTEKFYNRKRQHYSSYIKQSHHRQEDSTSNFLTVGSHAIQKMDFSSTNYHHNYKYLEENAEIKRRLKDNFNITDIRSLMHQEEGAKVLVLKKSDRKRAEHSFYSFTERRPKKVNQKLDSVVSSKAQTQRAKDFPIDEFIPIRKGTARKEPFIFGLSEKQANPQKNRDKLLFYLDFLWKVNYSNGLYVNPPQADASYRAFIGPGNNSNLIKSILRRRFWWTVIDKPEGANLSWTQLKINSVFQGQQRAKVDLKVLYPVQDIEQSINLKSQPVVALQQGHERIFNSTDLINWNRHMRKYRKFQRTLTQKTYKNRLQFLSCKTITKIQDSSSLIIHNHLQQNYFIGNKKALFYNMKKYYQLNGKDVFQALPLTFHITKGVEDAEFKEFLRSYGDFEERRKGGEEVRNIWIMKPGENSNRGNGISVCHGLEDIRLRLKAREKNSDGSLRTFILQKYMEKPLLYKGRKFDIRHYMLLTSFNGILKAYWFPQGYIRTSSSQFSLKKGTNLYIHLTNDAIQKHSQQYGKYEKGNKISYQKFQGYLNKCYKLQSRQYFYDCILQEMKQLAANAVRATFMNLDPNKREHNFQLLGMDFMIDEHMKPWLIEINTNPCLELSSPLLAKIIPSLLEQSFRICIDPFFPPPQEWPTNKKPYFGDSLLQENQLQLIFDQSTDGEALRELYGNNTEVDTRMGKIQEDDEVYQNDGSEEWNQKAQ